jgi:L-ascorbate metabolism protein UlaG (beta-lactamase superfamily)
MTVGVRYLQHSGWLVRTAGHVLVFDYVPTIPGVRPLPAGVAPGPRDFAERQVVVFVTHVHRDHYSPAVFEWAAEHPGVQYVLGWPLTGRSEAIQTLGPHEEWSAGGLHVWTSGSTDDGVGFLVRVDGLTVFHAGDLALWSEPLRDAFTAEIHWLKERAGVLDLAFLPLATVQPCEWRTSIVSGIELAERELTPRVLVPMHIRRPADFGLYERLRAELGPRLRGTQVVAPTARGERFRYAAGRLARVKS